MELFALTVVFLTHVKERLLSLIFVKFAPIYLFFLLACSFPLPDGRRYFRSEMKRKTCFPFAFRSLIRTFASIMENKENKYLAVAYKLYVNGENGQELVEEAPKEKPFVFITGFGVALDAFESQLSTLAAGEDFDFALTKEQAYGDYAPEHVLDLERDVFSINGHFDHEHIYEDAIIPLQNEEGHRFYGRVVEVGEEKVKVDLNHPLAGETLYFKGTVIENRLATSQEVEHLMKHLAGGCGGSCDECGGCGHDHEGCHEHGDGCGCGHCH